MHYIIYNNKPCWHELSWRPEKPAIILKIHEDFLKSVRNIPEDSPIVAGFKNQFGFKEFNDFSDRFWGFEKSFIRKKKDKQFFVYEICLPAIKRKTGMICPECHGTKKGQFSDKCYHCDGTGKEIVYSWHKAYAISASFTLFFMLSAYPETSTGGNLSQMMTIQTITDKDMHGGSLSGCFSIELVKWLRQLGDNAVICEVVEAMRRAYSFMYKIKKNDWSIKHDFRFYVRNGFFTADCPGQACGLHASSFDRYSKDEGYEFTCHNVDTPMQQLTLLAGLAALHDKARKDIKN